MTPTLVANRYARALVDTLVKPSPLAPAPPPAEQVVEHLRAFAALLRESAELREALATPSVPASKKRQIVDRIARAAQMPPVVRNFLLVLISRRRMGALPAIVDAFEEMMDRYLGVMKVAIASAQPLTDAQQEKLTEGLAAASGKRVWLNTRVDPDLLGGVVAQIGSLVLDGSVRGRLDALERRLSDV